MIGEPVVKGEVPYLRPLASEPVSTSPLHHQFWKIAARVALTYCAAFQGLRGQRQPPRRVGLLPPGRPLAGRLQQRQQGQQPARGI